MKDMRYPDPTQVPEELREQLAAIEHERWADWQNHVFEKSLLTKEGDMRIPRGAVQRWQRQIKTPYSNLSDDEKQSDLQEVDRYWPLLEAALSQAHAAGEREGRIAELELWHGKPPKHVVDNPPCQICHRLRQLQSDQQGEHYES